MRHRSSLLRYLTVNFCHDSVAWEAASLWRPRLVMSSTSSGEDRAGFEIIKADHTLIMNNPKARERVLNYLGHSS